MNEQWTSLNARTQGDVAWVTVAREQDRNSLDSETIAELEQHLETAEREKARVVIYRGAGDEHFIGGADGVEMCELSPDGARDFSRRIQGLFARMEKSSLCLIAAIHGLCFGGGLEFALACDLRLASHDARLGLPEVRLGILPGGGGTQRLPRVVGFGRAVEMILGGRLVSAEEAKAMGLVTEVMGRGELDARATEWAERILRIPAHAYTAAKEATYASREQPLSRGLALESGAFARCFEESYFGDRVREQLEDGRLRTTRRRGDERKAQDADA